MQELRDVVALLRAGNERLRQEQAAAVSDLSTTPSSSAMPLTAPASASAPLIEIYREVYSP